MNGTTSEAEVLVHEILGLLDFTPVCDVALAPPFPSLERVARTMGTGPLRLAAQNVHAESKGAFTGEVSAEMLVDLCVSYVIVGHSERRTLFGETDEGCRDKVNAVLRAGTSVILCIGETLDEREGEATLEVVARQLRIGLEGVDAGDLGRVVVAYEPVWAIGTGKTATPDQAQEVHAFIRSQLREKYGAPGEGVRLQYGGSMKADNAAELLAQPDIDGGLIGGAALKAKDFVEIIRAYPA
jgi:triosephosphate isomerase